MVGIYQPKTKMCEPYANCHFYPCIPAVYLPPYTNKQQFNMHTKDYNALRTAKKALDAWQRGEFTGDYTGFKAMVADDFGLLAHPTIGRFLEDDAKAQLFKLIEAREKEENSLMFSSITSFVTGKRVGFQIDVKGTLKEGKYPYNSYHLIVFEVDVTRDVITGFSEYFGTIDTVWLK